MSDSFTAAPVHKDLRNPDYLAFKAFLAKADGWSRAQIQEHQLRELNRVLALARRLPGYHERFALHGSSAGRLESPEDLRSFPTVSKGDIRDHLSSFTLPGRFDYVTTGGSTGIPMGLYRSPQAFAKELAAKAHQYHRVGWREGDRQVVLRGLPIADPAGYEFASDLNELRLSSYHLVPERMEQYLDLMDAYQPQWLRCYPSSAQIFSSHIEISGRRPPQLKGLLCASENLYGFQTAMFDRVFGGRTFSHYGHYELCVLAGFCETQDTYHVLPQYGFAELLDSDGRPVTTPGEVGEIVGTSFLMDGTILFRYRTNDFAVYAGDQCRHCGRLHEIWSRVEGRLQDFIVTSGGRYISMTAINMHDDIFDRLRQFQFEQREPGRVTFKYIPRDPVLPADALETIRARLNPKLGDDVELAFQAVDEIPITERGKHRFLKQHLSLSVGDELGQALFAR